MSVPTRNTCRMQAASRATEHIIVRTFRHISYVSSVLPPFPPSLQEFTTCRRGSISPTRAFASALTAICRVRALPLRRSLPGPSWLPGDLRGDLLQIFGRLRVFNTVQHSGLRRPDCPASGVLPRVGCPAITAPVSTRARAALCERFAAHPLVAGPNLVPWSALDPAASRVGS